MFHMNNVLELLNQDKEVFVIREVKKDKIYSMFYHNEWTLNVNSPMKCSYWVVDQSHQIQDWISKLFKKKKVELTETQIKYKKNPALELNMPMLGQGYYSFQLLEDAMTNMKLYGINRNFKVFKAIIPSSIKIKKKDGIEIEEQLWISKDIKKYYTIGDMYCSPTLRIVQEL